MVNFDDNEFVDESGIVWGGEGITFADLRVQPAGTLKVPIFSDNSNVPAECNLWKNDGTGAESDALYFREDDGSITEVGSGSGSYTDEDAQDAVGTILDATLSYDDAAPSIGVADGSIGTTQLSFDPFTQTEFSIHEAASAAHHAKFTNEEAQDAVGAIVDATMNYDDAGNSLGVGANGIDTTQLAASAVTPTEVDGSGGTNGQVLKTDGTASGVTWQDDASSGTAGSTFHEEYVNMEDAGADSSGSTSINSVLTTEAGDNTTLFFPPGTYLMDAEFSLDGFTNFGMVFADNAEILIQDTFPDKGIFEFGATTAGDGLYIKNLTIDMTAANTGAQPLYVQCNDNVLIDGLTVNGEHDDEDNITQVNGEFGIFVDIMTREGVGEVRNVSLLDGATDPSGFDGLTGVYSSVEHVGHITWQNVQVANMPDNGFYMSGADGSTHAENIYAVNNQIANIRMGGADGYSLDTFYIEVNTAGLVSPRGLRLRENAGLCQNGMIVLNADGDAGIEVSAATGDSTVRNVEVIDNVSGGNSGRLLEAPGSPGSGTRVFENCRFTADVLGTNQHDTVQLEQEVTMRDCTFDVAASGSTSAAEDRYGVELLAGSEGSFFENCVFRANQQCIWCETGNGNNTFRDCFVGRTRAGAWVNIDTNDNIFENVEFSDGTSGRGNLSDDGARTLVNGVGQNAGDPASTGDWNGNGYEGVIVRDTTNSNTYIYNAGSWSQIAST